MDEKEPVARTAGRYVRAAGVAIRKERERLAAEGAAKRAAEEAQAAQQAAAQPVQAAAAAPPPAAPAPAAAQAAPAKTKRPAPLPPPANRFLDRLFWILFITTLVATCLALLNVDMLTSGTAKSVVRVVLGCIFFVVAIAMLSNWQHSKDRILSVLTRKLWGLEHPTTRMGRFMRGVAKDVLTLVGIGWLAIGVFEVLRVVAE